MSLEFSLETNIAGIEQWLDNDLMKMVDQAARRSINRTMTSTRKETVKLLRQRLNIKAGITKKRDTRIRKATGGTLDTMEGVLSFSDKPMPMMQFVRGSKDIIKQKGIKVKKRKKVRVEIQRGKKFVMKGAFIQKAKTRQVFKSDKTGGFYKQSAPSIGEWINRQGIKMKIEKHAQKVYTKNFEHEFNFRFNKKADSIGRLKLKK